MLNDRVEFTSVRKTKGYNNAIFMREFYLTPLGKALKISKYELKFTTKDSDDDEIKIILEFVKKEKLNKDKEFKENISKIIAEYYLLTRLGKPAEEALVGIAKKYDCTVFKIKTIFCQVNIANVLNNIQENVLNTKIKKQEKKNYPVIMDS